MTAYNSEPFIAEALGSLIAQSMPSWECVVIDDGSTDLTADIVERLAGQDQRIRLVRCAHGGVSQARNVGLASLSDSLRYVALLDSDDRYLPDALESLLAVLVDRPDAVGVFGLAEYIDQDGRPVQPGTHSALQRSRRTAQQWGLGDLDPDADSTFDDISVAGAIWPSAVGLHRREVVDAVGGFDESFTRQGDWELYVRMSRHGPYAVVNRQVVWYRRHGFNLTSDIVESCYQRERVRQKAWHSTSNTKAQRRIVARGARRLQLVDMLRVGRRLVRDASDRRPRRVLDDAVALAMLGVALLRPGPARPSRRRVRWVRCLR